MGIEEREDEQEFQEAINEDVWIDPTPNLIEGIFYVPQKDLCLSLCKK